MNDTQHMHRSLDPITLEVVRNKLDGIANEMELTLLRSSFSPIVKEGARCLGEPCSRATARRWRRPSPIPIHLATLDPVRRRRCSTVSARRR